LLLLSLKTFVQSLNFVPNRPVLMIRHKEKNTNLFFSNFLLNCRTVDFPFSLFNSCFFVEYSYVIIVKKIIKILLEDVWLVSNTCLDPKWWISRFWQIYLFSTVIKYTRMNSSWVEMCGTGTKKNCSRSVLVTRYTSGAKISCVALGVLHLHSIKSQSTKLSSHRNPMIDIFWGSSTSKIKQSK